jgi:hypothetical protein
MQTERSGQAGSEDFYFPLDSVMKKQSASVAHTRMEAEDASARDKRIRVLHLIDSLELGGAQTALLAWLSSHDRSRFEVHLASMHGTRNSLYYKRAQQLGIPVILLSPGRFLPIYFFLLPLLILKGRYDVAHCHLFASNCFGKPLARFLGVPVVISHDRGLVAVRSLWAVVGVIVRLSHLCAEGVWGVSASVCEYLVGGESLSAARVGVVATG